MKKKPVAIDLNVIKDPYKMLSIIQGVDRIYSEIVIPFPLSFIEVWHPKWRSYTFYVFQDPTILNADLETFFGFTNGITVNNFIAGIKLLIMAYQKGMVRVVGMDDSNTYEKIGKQMLGTQRNFSNFESVMLPGNKKLFINPDLPVSEMLYGMQADDIIPVYGGSDFLNYWNKKLSGTSEDWRLERTPYSAEVDKTLQTLIYKEQISSLADAFEFAAASNLFEKLDLSLLHTVKDYPKKKELFLFSLEFAATNIIDSVIGAPVASASVFGYQFVKKAISKDAKDTQADIGDGTPGVIQIENSAKIPKEILDKW